MSPIATILTICHSLGYRTRIIYMMLVREHITVVPCCSLGAIHVKLFAQCIDLVGQEADISFQDQWTNHRELTKLIQRRLRAILFDGQDTRHIDERDALIHICLLEQVAKEVNPLHL